MRLLVHMNKRKKENIAGDIFCAEGLSISAALW